MLRHITLGLLVISLLLSACGIRHNIEPNSALEIDGNSAVLVMGLSPADYSIHLLRGHASNDVWNRPHLDVPEVAIGANDGYIVVKVPPTTGSDMMGLSMVFPGAYGPCQDSIAPAFILKANTVNYVGDLQFRHEGSSLGFRTSIDEDKAREYLQTRYRGFAERMETHPMKLMKVNSTLCNAKTITIHLP